MRMVVVCAALLAAVVGMGEKPKAKRGMPSAEERERLMQRYRARRIAKEGGMVVKADPANRRIAVVDAQSRVPRGDIEAFAAGVAERYSVLAAVEGRTGGITLDAVGDVLKDGKAGVAVVIVDVPGWPPLLVAPEGRWAAVNVGALVADGSDRLRERFVKEAWRAFAYVGGSADTLHDECLMRPVDTLADLDHLKAKTLSPEPEMRIRQHLLAMGVRPVIQATYHQACYEGWAPAPTNDVQKAIWEKVKADKERGPTNPITIPPPTQKK